MKVFLEFMNEELEVGQPLPRRIAFLAIAAEQTIQDAQRYNTSVDEFVFCHLCNNQNSHEYEMAKGKQKDGETILEYYEVLKSNKRYQKGSRRTSDLTPEQKGWFDKGHNVYYQFAGYLATQEMERPFMVVPKQQEN